MRPCGQKQDTLHAYIDGELSQAQKLEFEHHMFGCQECEAEFQETLMLVKVIEGLREEEALPKNFQASLRHKLFEESIKMKTLQRTAKWNKIKNFSYSAAAVCMVMLFAFWGINYYSNEGSLIWDKTKAGHLKTLEKANEAKMFSDAEQAVVKKEVPASASMENKPLENADIETTKIKNQNAGYAQMEQSPEERKSEVQNEKRIMQNSQVQENLNHSQVSLPKTNASQREQLGTTAMRTEQVTSNSAIPSLESPEQTTKSVVSEKNAPASDPKPVSDAMPQNSQMAPKMQVKSIQVMSENVKASTEKIQTLFLKEAFQYQMEGTEASDSITLITTMQQEQLEGFVEKLKNIEPNVSFEKDATAKDTLWQLRITIYQTSEDSN